MDIRVTLIYILMFSNPSRKGQWKESVLANLVITIADDSRSTFIHMVTCANPIPSESYETCAIVRAESIVAERFNSPIICTRLALINLRTTIRFHGTPLSSCKCVSPWNWWKLRACYKYGSCIHQHPCTTIHLPWSLNYERNWNESHLLDLFCKWRFHHKMAPYGS